MQQQIPAGGETAAKARPRALLVALDLAAAAGHTGLGLLAWFGLSAAILKARRLSLPMLDPLHHATLLTGLALLLAAALALALDPPAAPRRRNGAWASLAIAAVCGLLAPRALSPGLDLAVDVALCIAPLLAIALLAPAPQLLMPARIAQAMQAGAVLFFSIMAGLWPGRMQDSSAGASLLMVTGLAGALLLALWRPGRAASPSPTALAALALLLVAPLALYVAMLLRPALPPACWWLATLCVLAGQALGWRQHVAEP